MNCPICDEPMKHEVVRLDSYIVCEEYYTCYRGHYSYEYTYGYTREFINGKEFQDEEKSWSYKLSIAFERVRFKLHTPWLRK